MSKKTKNAMIPETLLSDLFKYFLIKETMNDAEIRNRIVDGLRAKWNASEKRTLYGTMKDKTLSPEERETARQEYLDSIGVFDSFR